MSKCDGKFRFRVADQGWFAWHSYSEDLSFLKGLWILEIEVQEIMTVSEYEAQYGKLKV